MKNISNHICDYGCNHGARYFFKYVNKYCCSSHYSKCPNMRKKNRKTQTGIKRDEDVRKKISEGKIKYFENDKNRKKYSIAQINRYKNMTSNDKEKFSLAKSGDNNGMFGKEAATKLTISKIKKKYQLFYKIEEMRYNPDKPGEKEIQVHCKNHNCKNSKEHGGWFSPTRGQITERRRGLYCGNDGSYFYCCEKCKNECPLFGLQSDPFQERQKQYTQEEYQQFREHVLNRDNYKCQFCGEKAEHVHHERPQKLEPFYALDPDFAWSCCKKCHYEKGHKDECSTGKLSKIFCT
ncbi:MAG: hypothetical protein K9L62_10345 [Vallitaleaceae bacterium]|nr:hypothetical protein [Vallitaleaceae bacterium]